MRAYESGSFAGAGDESTRLAVGIVDGPYRLRSANAVAWPAQGYSQRASFGRKFGEAFRAVTRVILPVLFLSVSLAAIYLYMDRALPNFTDAQGQWLTIGHLILPASFLTIHLTNRRYGPSYAFAQIVIAFAVVVAVAMFGRDLVRQVLPDAAVPGIRVVAAFCAAFFAAGFLSIVAFDAARGPRWWTAPLVGTAIAGLSFALIFYPAAFIGTSVLWGVHMAIYGGILLGAAVVGLIPYWLLRRTIQPLPGFGGY